MGGPGSGRWAYARTATVSEADTLGVSDLADGEVFDRPDPATVTWPGGRRQPDRSIRVCAVPAGDDHAGDGDATADSTDDTDEDDGPQTRAICLGYTVDDETVRETVRLDHMACNFGGTRAYLRCPGCGDRREDLHRPPGGVRFRCRECHDLGYRTARASGDDMTLSRLRFQRVHEKIDGTRPHPDRCPVPDRPEGMHTETYNRLVDELEAVREDYHRAYWAKLRAVSGRTDADSGT